MRKFAPAARSPGMDDRNLPSSEVHVMLRICKRTLMGAVVGLLLACGAARAQDGVEPQARGPIHEGYANPVDGTPLPGRIIDQEPPAPIEELPPDQKPDANVIWVGGYWAWDDAKNDFLYVSGFWRVPPPGRAWVPGSWRKTAGGWQWVGGFWAEPEQTETQYLPQPPAPLETGPSVPAPTPDHIYVPGSWYYTSGRYVWRAGLWTTFRPGWVWVPAHFRWTPVGYVFIDGYWDYALRDRGVLFSPVYIDRRYCYRPRWYYSPSYVVYDEALFGAMFVRPGYGHYYFGDYFEARYSRLGYRSWFSVSFSTGYTYDPLFSYYSVHYRRDPYWAPAIREVYVARYAGDIPRPPITISIGIGVGYNHATFVNNPVIVNKYTNITKTTNIVNVTNVTNNVVNIKNISNTTVNNTTVNNTNVNSSITKFKMQPVTAAQKEQIVSSNKQTQAVGKQRVDLEAKLQAQGGPVGKNDPPKSVKLNLPKAAVSTTGTGTGSGAAGMIHNNPPPPVVKHATSTGTSTGAGTGTGSGAGSGTGPRPGLGTLPGTGTGSGTGGLPKTGTGTLPGTGTGTGSGTGNPPKPGLGTGGSGNSPKPGVGAGTGTIGNPKPPPPKGGPDKDKDKDKDKKKDH
jgi:WXXGXW repeat (2 copies)